MGVFTEVEVEVTAFARSECGGRRRRKHELEGQRCVVRA
jgi:hypothetical protein